jgi:hypothetical protein
MYFFVNSFSSSQYGGSPLDSRQRLLTTFTSVLHNSSSCSLWTHRAVLTGTHWWDSGDRQGKVARATNGHATVRAATCSLIAQTSAINDFMWLLIWRSGTTSRLLLHFLGLPLIVIIPALLCTRVSQISPKNPAATLEFNAPGGWHADIISGATVRNLVAWATWHPWLCTLALHSSIAAIRDVR